VLGRQTRRGDDAGTGVDGGFAHHRYDGQGNAYLVTSYNAPRRERRDRSAGVQRPGQLITEYQAQAGTVKRHTRSPVRVHRDGRGVNNSGSRASRTRRIRVDVQLLHRLNNTISRLSSLSDTTGRWRATSSWAGYGGGTRPPQTNVNQTLISQTGGTARPATSTWPGRVRRVVDDLW